MIDDTRDDESTSESDDSRLEGVGLTYSSEAQMIERARRRYGSVGAIIASGMLGVDKLLGRRPKEEIPSIWEASGEPGDIDGDGIRIDLDDDTALESHPNRDAPRTRRIRKRRA